MDKSSWKHYTCITQLKTSIELWQTLNQRPSIYLVLMEGREETAFHSVKWWGHIKKKLNYRKSQILPNKWFMYLKFKYFKESQFFLTYFSLPSTALPLVTWLTNSELSLGNWGSSLPPTRSNPSSWLLMPPCKTKTK